MNDITDNGIKALKNKLQNKEIGFCETISCFLNKIYEFKKLNCFIDVFEKEALERAAALEKKLRNGELLGPLAGIPVAIKDNISVAGKVNSCCSEFLRGVKSTYDAEIVKKLRDADAIIIGKTNMDEFAMGTSNETSCYGPVLNPVDNERVPGGSSGGSACAVKIGACAAALGTDTGGSIRQPASHCGVVGFKPTKNSLSNKGIVALAPSMDQVGILASDTEEVAELFSVLRENSYGTCKIDNCKSDNIKIGIAEELIYKGMSEDISSALSDAHTKLASAGIEFVKISIPSFKSALADYMILSYAEAAVSLDRFDGINYGNNFGGDAVFNRTKGFGAEAKRRIMLGKFFTTEDRYQRFYLKALGVRKQLCRELNESLSSCDCIMTPTSLMTAYKLREEVSQHKEIAYSDMFTVLANLADLPAVSVAFGTDSKGLPIGIHFIGRKYEDLSLLKIAGVLEK